MLFDGIGINVDGRWGKEERARDNHICCVCGINLDAGFGFSRFASWLDLGEDFEQEHFPTDHCKRVCNVCTKKSKEQQKNDIIARDQEEGKSFKKITGFNSVRELLAGKNDEPQEQKQIEKPEEVKMISGSKVRTPDAIIEPEVVE